VDDQENFVSNFLEIEVHVEIHILRLLRIFVCLVVEESHAKNLAEDHLKGNRVVFLVFYRETDSTLNVWLVTWHMDYSDTFISKVGQSWVVHIFSRLGQKLLRPFFLLNSLLVFISEALVGTLPTTFNKAID